MKISDATIGKAVELVQNGLLETGIIVRAEVQDGGEFLLLIAEMPSDMPTENNNLLLPYKQQLLQVLSALIPPKEDGDYSWMVIFTSRNEVVDSVVAAVPME